MEFNEFGILEEKINQALLKIEELRHENSELKKQIQKLEQEKLAREEKWQQVEQELSSAQELNQRRDESIRQKVSSLLERLDNI